VFYQFVFSDLYTVGRTDNVVYALTVMCWTVVYPYVYHR